jgi:hypothetical protein
MPLSPSTTFVKSWVLCTLTTRIPACPGFGTDTYVVPKVVLLPLSVWCYILLLKSKLSEIVPNEDNLCNLTYPDLTYPSLCMYILREQVYWH